jgi:hypothetical protein
MSHFSYPDHPLSPFELLRTISESFAVASSFKRSTVFLSGGGSPVSDFDCLELGSVRMRLVVYDTLVLLERLILTT